MAKGAGDAIVMVALTSDERWALDGVAVMAIEHRQIPAHWHHEHELATASRKLRDAGLGAPAPGDLIAEFVAGGCLLHTEDGLFCFYCEAEVEYPDDSGQYDHVELPHAERCVWNRARAFLAQRGSDKENG